MAYVMKVTLHGSKPPIWRRIQVDSKTTLGELHEMLQVVMGWTNSHLHVFRINGDEYGEPAPEFELDYLDEKSVILGQVVKCVGETLRYDYDFGDGWEHRLLVEKILAAPSAAPECLTGKRSCPPEDCGGIWGYREFLTAIGDPGHEDHDRMLEWIGGSFDPDEFDLSEVNDELQNLFCTRL